MFGEKQSVGILFWHEDANQKTWVLIGRKKKKPNQGKWTMFSTPKPGCRFSVGTKQAFMEYQNTAQILAEELLGFTVKTNKLVLLSRKALFPQDLIYSMQLHSMLLLPKHPLFHLFLWSRLDMLPTPLSSCLKRTIKTIERINLKDIS